MHRVLAIIIAAAIFSLATGQEIQNNTAKAAEPEMRHSIGSSLFLLGNFIPEDDIYAFQLDYYYKMTDKDVLIVEGIT